MDTGVILTVPEKPMPERLSEIYAGLNELLQEYQPDCMAVELLYFASNVTTAITVGLVLLK